MAGSSGFLLVRKAKGRTGRDFLPVLGFAWFFLASCGGAPEIAPPVSTPVCLADLTTPCDPVDPVSACGSNTCVDGPVLAADEVRAIMESAARAVPRELAVAVVDRRGVVLGVGATFEVDYAARCLSRECPAPDIGATDDCGLLERAVQAARTAAFFSADETPLTSRSVRFLSGEHFPPGVRNTMAAALFGIENTNRGCSFDAELAPLEGVVPRARNLVSVFRPELRCESPRPGTDPTTARCGCTTGIYTLPGAVPIYKGPRGGLLRHAGGVGVVLRGAFPPPDSVAAFDDDRVLRREFEEAPREIRRDLELAEFAARSFAGDETGLRLEARGIEPVCERSDGVTRPTCCDDDPPCDFNILPLRDPPFDPVIFVDGVEIPEVLRDPPIPPEDVGTGGVLRELVVPPNDRARPVGVGWLLGPTDSTEGLLSEGDVREIVDTAIREAQRIRAAIRLPNSKRTAMVFAISDTNGVLLGVYRMPDATVFSIDVAVAKSRNVVYFSSPSIDPIDAMDCPGLADCRGVAIPPGTAVTNRTISFASQPFFPSGIEGSLEGFPEPFAPGPYRRVFLEDSITPCTNGREPPNGRQNGVVFFPGSAPLYRAGRLVGGFGVSGDGVEQDDIVAFAGTRAGAGFEPVEPVMRADQVFVRGVRLPYLKFNRRPEQ